MSIHIARFWNEVYSQNFMPRDSQKLDLYIIEKGIYVLLVWSQQPLTKELPEYMGIKIIGYK